MASTDCVLRWRHCGWCGRCGAWRGHCFVGISWGDRSVDTTTFGLGLATAMRRCGENLAERSGGSAVLFGDVGLLEGSDDGLVSDRTALARAVLLASFSVSTYYSLLPTPICALSLGLIPLAV